MKNGTFRKFLKSKFHPNIHQKRTKLHHFKKNFLGGACPQTPLTMRTTLPCAACRYATCKFPNLKKKILAPLPNPGYAPAKGCTGNVKYYDK